MSRCQKAHLQRRIAPILSCALTIGCVACHRTFQVVPQTPNYLLRAPDLRETAFSDILRTYNGFEPGRPSMDLRPMMELRIENAYYQPGAPKRGLNGFLGTEVAQYEVTSRGLRLLSFQPMKNRPESDLPVQRLISDLQMSYRYYRFFFEVFFKNAGNSHGSVLLGAKSIAELEQLSAELATPETVCNENSRHCTVFPEACSVSVEMKITVNGTPQDVLWRALLADVIPVHAQHIELKRLYGGRLTPVKIDTADRNQMHLPLLPGDQVNWN
jgi:hypothetical protein